MVGKPSETIPPRLSNSSDMRPRSVVSKKPPFSRLVDRVASSMKVLHRQGPANRQDCSYVYERYAASSVLHGLRESTSEGTRVSAGADGPQCLYLDLPGPLLRDTQSLGDLAQGTDLVAAVQTVAHLQDAGLALGERPYGLVQRPLPLPELYPGVVVLAPLVGQEISHLGASLGSGSDPGVYARDGLGDLAQPAHLSRLYPKPRG